MKTKKTLFFVIFVLTSITGQAQLIGGDVNKPINTVYPLGASNFRLQFGSRPYAVPTFTVTPPSTCGGNFVISINWSAGTTASSVRYFNVHGGLQYPGASVSLGTNNILNASNSFSSSFTLAPGIYTFGVHLDPYDDIIGNNLGAGSTLPGNDLMINTTWGAAGAHDQNRAGVFGVTILPTDVSSRLHDCAIAVANASNCTSANGSATISNLALNTNYQVATKVNAVFGSNLNSGPSGTITINNLLTGIYPIRIRKSTENCYRQFNVKIGNNTGVDCFADNQLIDATLGSNLISNGHFGDISGVLPNVGGTPATSIYTSVTFNNGDPQDTRYALIDSTDVFFKGNTANRYEWRLRNWQFSGASNLAQHRHLWSAMQATGDHTGSLNQNNGTAHNPGHFMLVNANYANDAVLTIRNINLVAGNSYYFSFWAKNMQPFMAKNKNNSQNLDTTYQPIVPRLGMAVDSILYNFSTLNAITEPANYTGFDTMLRRANWERYNMRFVAPVTKTGSNISIYNFQQGGYGNDFAIDDIEFLALSAVGDRVWNDLDADGLQDINEPGMANIGVTLLDDIMKPLQTTVTDAFGYYQFANIFPAMAGSNYYVKFKLPTGYRFSPKAASMASIDGSDANTTGITDVFTLLLNASNISIDCGLVFDQPILPASIGNLVWLDVDADGVQDGTESGLANVTVQLINSSDVVVNTTITDASGFYRFDNVTPGSYRVGITQPSATIVSPKDIGSDNTDSDLNFSGSNKRRTDLFSIVANQQITNIDLGVTLTPAMSSSFGDLCWQDLNQNGIQEAGEPGLPGVKVVLIEPGLDNTLLTVDDIRVDSMVTDAFGIWQFTNLTNTRYAVQFFPPAGYNYTLKNQGTNEALDSDIDGTLGISNIIGISNNPYGLNYNLLDVGFIPSPAIMNPNSVGDIFWNDINGDGIQSGGEFGIPGVNVDLLNISDIIVSSTTTDLNGKYKFTNVVSGTYKVRFNNIPPGYQYSTKNQGTASTDSDIDFSTGISDPFSVSGNQNIDSIDGGVRQVLSTGKSSVGSYIWYDFDSDGVQDIDETGVPNVVVRLRQAGANSIFGDADDIVLTDTTNSLGQYVFNGLNPGSYRVDVVYPFGILYSVTTKDNTNDNLDSDFNTAVSGVSSSDIFKILQGEDRINLDCGIIPSSLIKRIGNRVWKDKNGNGIQDAAETEGVQGVVVQLLNNSGSALADSDPFTSGIQAFQTTTNQYGYWHLVGVGNFLVSTTYIPRFALLPPGYRISPNAIGTSSTDSDPRGDGRTNAITVPSGNYTNFDLDLGLIPESNVVGDFVWDDQNGNGLQDASEPGINNVTATIYNSNNVALGSAVTDAKGKYYFPNVDIGSYYLRYDNYPAGMHFTTKEANLYATNGNNVSNSTKQTDLYTFIGFGDTLHIDAGLRVVNTANVGNKVWADTDSDGIQDSNELPLAGIVATLKNAGLDGIRGNADDYILGSTITDGSGNYQFIITPTGNNYYIEFSNKPGTSIFTDPNMGTGTNDSRVNPSGQTPLFNLAYGGTNQNQDAGIRNIGVLNVKFLNFSVEKMNSTKSNLTWQLVQTDLITHCEIWHSTDGINFSKIAPVASNQSNVYSYVHSNPAKGLNYYKIGVINIAGQMQFSTIKSISFIDTKVFSIYPNPVAERVYIQSTLLNGNHLQYTIHSIEGKSIQKGTISNSVTTSINVSQFASGKYIISIFDKNKLLSVDQFIKQP